MCIVKEDLYNKRYEIKKVGTVKSENINEDSYFT